MNQVPGTPGIHAIQNQNKLADLYRSYCGHGGCAGCAGEVYLWGKVVECEIGYRAEFAYPKSLLVDTSDPINIMQLEENYGVPVKIWEEEVEFQRQHGICGSGPPKCFP